MKRRGLVPTLVAIRHLLFALTFAPVLVQASEYLPTFFDMDKDGDGFISAEEAEYWSMLVSKWQRFDTDGNNAVDLREWEAVDIEAVMSESKR